LQSLQSLQSSSSPDSASLLRLVDLGKRLAAETDPDQVLRIVLHEAIELTGTERGFIVLVVGEEFEFALAENLDWSEVEQPSFEVSRTLIRRVLDEGTLLILTAPRTESKEATSRSLAEIGVQSVACIPVLHAGSALGVLYLDSRVPAHSFREPTERVLELLAAQAGAALDNARAHLEKSKALEAAEENLRRHRSQSELRLGYGEMIGSSSAMQDVYRKLDLMTPTELPVLVLGETGTGKELVARLIHARGPRAAREFVAANCAAIAESLLEAELFGHERGAFTGAERARPGLFELAQRGTLFLDEVGDMSLRMQADLLRVLQSGEVRRVGGRETFHVDVRVIAATHRDLEESMRRGEFRQDLYYRLNVLVLQLPALRARAEDIPLLLVELLRRATPEGRTPPRISERALRRLLAYPWPGNVRELQNILRRMSVLGVDVVDERHLPHEVLRAPARVVRAGSLRRAEDDAVRHAIAAAKGNKAAAARILGVDRKTLYARLRKLHGGGGSGRL
jgi:transcriptional regulator with GAF, ATPase, and Fis domain